MPGVGECLPGFDRSVRVSEDVPQREAGTFVELKNADIGEGTVAELCARTGTSNLRGAFFSLVRESNVLVPSPGIAGLG